MISLMVFFKKLFLAAQKISPEGKPKVQLQIVLHDISSYTFHFCTPEGREKQIAERNKVKVSHVDFWTHCMHVFCCKLEEAV